MLNLIKLEFHKLKTSKIFWLMILSGIVQGFAGPILSDILRTKTGEKMIVFSFQLQQFLFYMILIGVFTYFIGSEFYSGSVKNLIAYGHRRSDIVIAKSIAFYLGVVIISLIFPMVITIINTVINGYGTPFDLHAILFLLRVSLLMSLVYAGMSSLAILFTFVSRNAIVPCALFIALDTVCRVCQAMTLRSELVKAIYGKTVFYQVSNVTLENMTFAQGMEAVVVSLITMLICTAIAIIAFKRADIK